MKIKLRHNNNLKTLYQFHYFNYSGFNLIYSLHLFFLYIPPFISPNLYIYIKFLYIIVVL